ncbi:MAG: cysteine synthase A [Tissierellia bacterium]|nr:cysteine synthase A [Tissierellia bacterium]
MKKLLDTIGNTQLIKLEHVTKHDIYVKVEKTNPAGSIKDRPAYYMIKDAIETGKLQEGMKIVEPTSGNTGIALAMIGKALGFEVEVVMSESMSVERRALMKSFGAKVILTKGELGLRGSVEKAQELVEQGGYFMPNQFDNPANIRAHMETTAPEIIESKLELKGFIAGVGTGGTVTGVGRVLKDLNKDIQVWALEPAESSLFTENKPGPHKIQGIGPNVVPKNFDRNVVDQIITIKSDDAIEMAKRLSQEEGLMVGISSGANVLGAIKMAEAIGGPIVTVLPDTSERYLSTALFKGYED